ncbi:MAG: preprotein translocase subunit SecE [Acaryochloridaceae cyanobacterium CSU_5_19]|nr:preprotein translocase subunit SecE [Acaryochloridaceae cyanobacterium CSU_5_19]
MAKRRKKQSSPDSNGSSAPQDIDLPNNHDSAESETEVPVSTIDAEPEIRSDAVAPPSSATKGSIGFLKSTQEELGKVVWPDRQQLISESIAVFLMVSLSAILISFIDGIFRWASGLIFG